MDQNQHVQPTKGIDPLEQEAHGKNPMMAPTNLPTQPFGTSLPSSYPREQQCASQYMYPQQQDHLQQQLDKFWRKQCKEIEETTNIKTHSLPLARIKKIMKAEGDVQMISAEAPMMFAKACDMFIQELTMRAWANTEKNKRRSLQKSDIAYAITRTEEFDFLIDVVPRDETMEHVGIPLRGIALTQNVPYMSPHFYVPSPPYGAPGMIMRRPDFDQNHRG